jgi:hypothetical protein
MKHLLAFFNFNEDSYISRNLFLDPKEDDLLDKILVRAMGIALTVLVLSQLFHFFKG